MYYRCICRVGELSKAYKDMIILADGLQWLNEVFNLTKDVHKFDIFEIKEMCILNL